MTEESPPARYCPVCREDLSGVSEPLCPGCERVFDPDDPTTTSPHANASCKRCNYDLKGVDTGECPECGTPFDPLDESTYANPITLGKKKRDRTFIVLSIVCFLIAAWFLAQRTIIPRPAYRWNGDIVWTLWLWLDEPYGIWYDTADQRVRFWAGQAVRVDGGASMYTPPIRAALTGPVQRPRDYTREAYTVTRNDDGTWTLDVHEAGVPWQRVLLGFNTTRTPDEIVGVRIQGNRITGNPEPFTATGNGSEILQALIDQYNLTIFPGTTLSDPEHVWIQNEDRQLERVTVQAARDLGYNPEPIIGNRIARTLPRIR